AGDIFALRPGLSADVEVIMQRLSDVLLLPRDAVHRKEGKWGVSVVQGDQVSFHEVKTGFSDGERIEIKSDLPVGTEVVLNWAASAGASSQNRGRPGRP
ncbi:efflux RND transporter periplasmic adaptor subunit, partial [Nitrospira defluvii]|nr:efflux RND transporter periplasmic adaptor subunit [Nitrospira defluvii]